MLKYLLEKEFKLFFRNPFLPKMIFILPAVVTIIFPMVANFEIKNIQLYVIDHNKSTVSYQLIEKIQASKYFIITEVSNSNTTAFKKLEHDQCDMILEIPARFEQDLIKEQKSSVMIKANAINGVKGGLGSVYLGSVIQDFSNQIRNKLIIQNEKIRIPSLKIIPKYEYNPTLEYYVFMVPALMIMVLAIICGFLPALNIVSEKENGTMEQINVSPVKKIYFILSKLIPYWIIGFVVLSICFIAAWVVYGLVPKGSILTIYLFSSLFVLAFSGFGLVISNYAKTFQQAMFMMFFFVMSFIFMSGLYTPVANMPNWAQMLSHFSPLKYIIIVLRSVYLKGSGFFDMIPIFFALGGFAIFFNLWAVLSYKKEG